MYRYFVIGLNEEGWHHLKSVEKIKEGVLWINAYGTRYTQLMITDDPVLACSCMIRSNLRGYPNEIVQRRIKVRRKRYGFRYKIVSRPGTPLKCCPWCHVDGEPIINDDRWTFAAEPFKCSACGRTCRVDQWQTKGVKTVEAYIEEVEKRFRKKKRRK